MNLDISVESVVLIVIVSLATIMIIIDIWRSIVSYCSSCCCLHRNRDEDQDEDVVVDDDDDDVELGLDVDSVILRFND